ncbi:MAG: copper chaperone PCu(A)C [Microbacteriaceae bacterium]|nr:copper chaperone PCu(A)C [Microbacteriaceae bacterium]
MQTRTTAKLTVLALAVTLAITGCSTPVETEVEPKPAGETITIHDGWVKAADQGMSAAFGELKNTGAQDITVVTATTDASTGVELHETVANDAGEMVMREKEGGFTIPAGTSLTLEPGGSHIMLMGLVNPIKAGDEISFTVTFSDGSTYEFMVPAKDFAGANENYVGGDMDMEHDTDMKGNK